MHIINQQISYNLVFFHLNDFNQIEMILQALEYEIGEFC